VIDQYGGGAPVTTDYPETTARVVGSDAATLTLVKKHVAAAAGTTRVYFIGAGNGSDVAYLRPPFVISVHHVRP
jgi:hypothetical protein